MKELMECLQRLESKFDAIGSWIKIINQRLDAMDKRFDAIDQRLDAMDQRLDGVDVKLGSISDELIKIRIVTNYDKQYESLIEIKS